MVVIHPERALILKIMDIAHLKTFLEIYRTRHFGKSAEKLCITQSAASARIKQLEERLGVSLFTRSKHSIEPTSAGHRFHKYAEMTVNGWESARQMLGLPEECTRNLSVGCLPDSWHFFVKNWLEGIQKQMPDTGLNLTIHPEHNIQELILSNALDVGFVFEPVNIPKLSSIQVASVQLQLFANCPGLSVHQAMEAGYIMADWGALFKYEHSRTYRDYPTAATNVNYGVMALDLLLATRQQRAAYLPDFMADRSAAPASLFPVQDAIQFEKSLFLVYREDSNSLSLIEELLGVVSKLAEAASL